MSKRRTDPYSMSNPGASSKTPLVPTWVAEHDEHMQRRLANGWYALHFCQECQEEKRQEEMWKKP